GHRAADPADRGPGHPRRPTGHPARQLLGRPAGTHPRRLSAPPASCAQGVGVRELPDREVHAAAMGGLIMPVTLNQIGQIGLPFAAAARAGPFYEMVRGLRRLFRFGALTFFDWAGVRLLLEKTADVEGARGCLYFRCADIALTMIELMKRGAAFDGPPHRIA